MTKNGKINNRIEMRTNKEQIAENVRLRLGIIRV